MELGSTSQCEAHPQPAISCTTSAREQSRRRGVALGAEGKERVRPSHVSVAIPEGTEGRRPDVDPRVPVGGGPGRIAIVERDVEGTRGTTGTGRHGIVIGLHCHLLNGFQESQNP